MDYKKFLIFIYLITLCIGIIFIIFNPMPYGNSTDYDIHAINLLQGNGISLATQPPYFPDVYRTPGMGLFLCLIYKFFGVNYVVVKLIQAALNALVPLLIFFLCKRTFNERFAYVAAISVAVYPFTTLFVPVVSSEILCIFLFCLGLFLFEIGRSSNKKIFFLFSGLSYGYCLLVRPGTSLMPIFLTAAYLMVSDFRKIWKCILVFNLSVFIIWCPWIIRNYKVSKRFIPLTVESHEMIYWASGSIGKYFENRVSSPKYQQQRSQVSRELSQSGLEGMENVILEQKLFLKFAIQNIKDEPFKYLISTLARIPRMWISLVTTDASRSYQFPGGANLYRLVTLLTSACLLLAIYGIWILRRSWRKVVFLALPIVYFSLTHMFVLAEARFTLPGRPFLVVFALAGLIDILKRICGCRGRVFDHLFAADIIKGRNA